MVWRGWVWKPEGFWWMLLVLEGIIESDVWLTMVATWQHDIERRNGGLLFA
jgi:hypothetical protein